MTSGILAILIAFGSCSLVSTLDEEKKARKTPEADVYRDNLSVKEFWRAWSAELQPTCLKLQELKLANGESRTFRTDLWNAESRIREIELKEILNDRVFPNSDGNKYRLPEEDIAEKNELTAKVASMEAEDAERHRRLLSTNREYRRLSEQSDKLSKPWIESLERIPMERRQQIPKFPKNFKR